MGGMMGDMYLGSFIIDCVDKSYGCLPPRSTVASIAIISMVACAADMLLADAAAPTALCCPYRAYVDSAKHLLQTFFFMANMLLLLASIVENASLVRLYVWYTLAFVMLGLATSLADFLLRYRSAGAAGSCALFVPEVAFLFVIFRCLPLVDTYRKHLEGRTSILSC